jgi:hypothetical protein
MRTTISARKWLMITLRYLTSGGNFHLLEEVFRISVASISLIVPEVCTAIWDCLGPDVIKCPRTAEEWKEKAAAFNDKWDYPRAVGCLDGKHVSCQAFGNSGSTFRNYKSGFSIVLMALADADCQFMYVDVGTEGASNDAGVFGRGSLKAALDSGEMNLPQVAQDDPLQVPYAILGDDAFGLTTTLMKPYPHKTLEPKQRVFNYRFSRARRTVENAFGLMASRFRVFRAPILQNYGNACKTVQACVVLHNFLCQHSAAKEAVAEEAEVPELPEGGAMQPLENLIGNRQGTGSARIYRDKLADYFFDEGQVPFQWHCTFRT